MQNGPVILDTDTLSELCRGNLRVREHAADYLRHFGRLTLSSITVFERLRGYHLALREGKPFEPQLRAFEALLAGCIVLPFDAEAAAVAAQIWSSVGRKHRRETGDILIAAVAVARQLPLVTRNQSDFQHLAKQSSVDLLLLDWTKSKGRRAR
jgi:predicted nucleic acid-binding protein